MSDFSFVLPEDFADYEWEVEVKGWFSGAKMLLSGKSYQLNFYDPVRLGQTIGDDLELGRAFFEPNLIIVKSVTRSNMEQAARHLAESDQTKFLVPD